MSGKRLDILRFLGLSPVLSLSTPILTPGNGVGVGGMVGIGGRGTGRRHTRGTGLRQGRRESIGLRPVGYS
jgi:hypothetical protein